MENDTLQILRQIKNGTTSPEEALLQLKTAPYKDIEYAKIDLHRNIRQGVTEIIYGAGKTTEQLQGILTVLKENKKKDIMITKLSQDKAEKLKQTHDLTYYKEAQIASLERTNYETHGSIVIATGGTSDIPIAEESAITAELLGNKVTRLYDVGVAGLHRLLSNIEPLMSARVIIAIAGMEGALASVIGGLATAPLIAVPTSIGYGANFGGLSALLSMLNSCAAGSAVVNIDNGFGAAYIANKINHTESAK
ncbi:MAG: nickel pincer cofactor biosynthesis protein LarB [Synergistaceae bacterium]